ncbi:MAG TPA: hypothetical protein VKB72_13340 [Steroidobacteraceae bacterium]|nr:hypothetical protein [Steroidobacteraceae bacterium]
MSLPTPSREGSAPHRLGIAWVCMWLALAAHVADEALTGFLPVYNATVRALRAQLGFWPMPVFEFKVWLTGLLVLVAALAVLSPCAFRNAPWLRPIFYFVAVVIGLLNAAGHTLATILGHTVSTVQVARPAPGFYSSPLLVIAAIYALRQLWLTRRRPLRDMRVPRHAA